MKLFMAARNSVGGEMGRIISWLLILAFISPISAVMAHNNDGGTPSLELDSQPSAKSGDSIKTDTRENEKDAVESELQELRDVVQSQSEELHELRARLAAVEAGKTVSVETPGLRYILP